MDNLVHHFVLKPLISFKMTIIYTLLLISSIVWFLPLFKQLKTPYWNYFYIFAVADPLIFVLRTTLKINPSYLCMYFIVLQISFLQKRNNIKIIALFGIILTVILGIMFYKVELINLMVIIYFLIMISLIFSKVAFFLKNNLFNLFLSLLLFYNIINLSKFMAVLFNPELGAISFYLGYTFQIIFALLFSFININTKNFKLNLTYFEKRAE